MNHNITPRAATANDCMLLAQLNAPIQAMHAKHFSSIFKADADLDEVARHFSNAIATLSHALLIIFSDSMPAGYLWHQIHDCQATAIQHPYKRLTVHQLGVLPTFRKQGLGSRLMDRVITDAQEHTVDVIWLNSWSFNTDAHRFFQSFGFATKSINMHLQTPAT